MLHNGETRGNTGTRGDEYHVVVGRVHAGVGWERGRQEEGDEETGFIAGFADFFTKLSGPLFYGS